MIECTKQTDRKSKTFFNIGEYSFCPNEVPFLHLHLQISALGNKQTAKKAGNLENVMRFLWNANSQRPVGENPYGRNLSIKDGVDIQAKSG